MAALSRGTSWSTREAAEAPRAVRSADVEHEADRRRRVLGIDEARMRAYVLGRPMPDDLRYLDIQIELACTALCRLFPIPTDYAADVYWPNPYQH